jgi:hypothetical protein
MELIGRPCLVEFLLLVTWTQHMGMTAQGHTLHGMMALLMQMDSNEQLQLIIFRLQHSVAMVPQQEIRTRTPPRTRW